MVILKKLKVKIAPSILSADLTRINEEIKEVAKYCDLIHVDVMDGIFVPNTAIELRLLKKIKTKIPLDIHLMVHEPSELYLKDFIDSGAYSITVHQEACLDPTRQINFLKKNKVKCGIAIKPKTSLDSIKKYIDMVDMVLIMTVEPGFGGQRFIESTMNKVRELRKLRPALDIEVDGGINNYTARIAFEEGANVFVVGTSIFGSNDKVGVLREIRRLVEY